MIVLLLIFLSLLLIDIYFLNKFDFFSPSLVVVSTFFLSSLIVFLNYNVWEIDIHPMTVLVISLALITFFIGELIARIGPEIKNKKKMPLYLNLSEQITVGKEKIFIISVFMVTTIFFQFNYLADNALIFGGYNNFGQLLYNSRAIINDSSLALTQSPLLTHSLIISKCLAYFFIFTVIYNKIFHNNFKNIYIYLIPISLYLSQAILTTGRTHFIYFFTFILLLIVVLEKKKKNWSNTNDLKILSYLLIGGILFVTIFSLIGSQRSTTNFDITRSISLYGGSSILALDYFIINDDEPPIFFGEETLYSLNSLLRRVGVDVPFKEVYLEAYENDNFRTNIYTSLRRYIHDYTFAGMLIIQLFLGFLYTKFIMYIKYKDKIGVSVIFLGMFFYPLVEYSIEERFLVSIFTFSTVYHIIYMSIIFNFFTKNIPLKMIKVESNKKRGHYETN